MGYYLAGFDVIGVDVKPQPLYPFPFIRRDAMSVLADDSLLSEFDAIHASPPCHSETPLRAIHHDRAYQDLLTPTLALLDDLIDIPWVVENVEMSKKMPGSVILCGTYFRLGAGGRVLRRHRRFLASVPLPDPGNCWCAGEPVGGVYGNLTNGGSGSANKFSPDEARRAMGIDWMSTRGLTLAVPPDYTRWVGDQLIQRYFPTTLARDHQRQRFSSGRIEQFARL
jgi:DNA (cytosine-5)-methyltransferase 1